nr:hypothetical protein [uncultured Desulfobulbus sp.]
MQNINRISQSCGVDDAKCPGFVPDSNFFNTFADRRHGLEIVWMFAPLNFIKLFGILSGIIWKGAYTLQRIAVHPQAIGFRSQLNDWTKLAGHIGQNTSRYGKAIWSYSPHSKYP